jgi:hypothetical protein
MSMRQLTLVLAVFVAACATTSPSGGTPGSGGPPALGAPAPPRPGVVTGRLVSQKSDGSDRAPMAGQAIGAFRHPVLPGKVLQHPPPPVAEVQTAADGRFTFAGLQPGRYFIGIAGTGPSVPGRWVTVTPDRGASVLLVRCTNCPTPL